MMVVDATPGKGQYYIKKIMKTNKNSFPGLIIIFVIFVGILIYSLLINHNLVVKDAGYNIPADSKSARLPEVKQERAPLTCVDSDEGSPVITSLSKTSGFLGDKLEINGCNFSGFEGDKVAWIENPEGAKGILYGELDSTAKSIKVVLKSPLCGKDNSYSGLPCGDYLTLMPGSYKIYTEPWGKKSNAVDFIIN